MKKKLKKSKAKKPVFVAARASAVRRKVNNFTIGKRPDVTAALTLTDRATEVLRMRLAFAVKNASRDAVTLDLTSAIVLLRRLEGSQ